MARRSSMRASDADRERIAERLRQAAGEGRLAAHELEERLARTFAALTYGDLDAVVDDLPDPAATGPRGFGASGRPPQRRRRSTGWALARRYPIPTGIVALLAAVTVLAVVASAVAFVVSGLWIIPLVLLFVLRGRGLRRPRRYGYLYRSGRSW